MNPAGVSVRLDPVLYFRKFGAFIRRYRRCTSALSAVLGKWQCGQCWVVASAFMLCPGKRRVNRSIATRWSQAGLDVLGRLQWRERTWLVLYRIAAYGYRRGYAVWQRRFTRASFSKGISITPCAGWESSASGVQRGAMVNRSGRRRAVAGTDAAAILIAVECICVN